MPGQAVRRLFILGILLAPAAPISGEETARDPVIGIIIDDIGYRHRDDQEAISLPGPLAFAILPHSPHAESMSAMAREHGKDVLMHLPMEATEAGQNRFLGPGALTLNMGRAEFVRTLAWDLHSVPGAIGVNNHMGSLLTRQHAPMEWLMESLRIHNKFYIDSLTSHRSVAGAAAVEKHIPYLRRDVFLDNLQEAAHIDLQFEYLVNLAKRKGSAVAIGHPYPETIEVLRRRLSNPAAYGVALVSVRTLVSVQAPDAAPAYVSWTYAGRTAHRQIAIP